MNKTVSVAIMALITSLVMPYGCSETSSSDLDDRHSSVTRLALGESLEENPVWSLDSRSVYFEKDGQICNADTEHGITFALTDGLNPMADPDSGQVYFLRSTLEFIEHSNSLQGELTACSINSDSTNFKTIGSINHPFPNENSAVWSPDGTQIALFVREEYSGNWPSIIDSVGTDFVQRLAIWDAITREITVIPDLRPWGNEPEWSPDSRTLLVVGKTDEQLDRQSETEHAETDIWTVDVVTGVMTNVSSDPDHNTFPLWIPDGSRIAFHTYTYDVEDRSQPQLIDSIWVVNTDGSNRQLLVSNSFPMGFPLFDSRYDWSPDGSSMVLVLNTLSSEDSRSITGQLMQDIWIKDIDGTDQELLLSTPFRYGYTGKLRWSPDGSTLALEWAPMEESPEGKLIMGNKHIYLLEAQ